MRKILLLLSLCRCPTLRRSYSQSISSHPIPPTSMFRSLQVVPGSKTKHESDNPVQFSLRFHDSTLRRRKGLTAATPYPSIIPIGQWPVCRSIKLFYLEIGWPMPDGPSSIMRDSA
ncbi:hypothetical protein BKA64DRAFT_660436 [Cadophora sp. MPI-SDFR-AT-0126]|nr:hypothetical protein BKA64DRAFT_660436 [Leotiomycetes sp. MPI-SDFR-AT-0126]